MQAVVDRSPMAAREDPAPAAIGARKHGSVELDGSRNRSVMRTLTKTGFSRRSLLAGLAAVTAAPVWANEGPSNPDVVIIGAGSAGLSAARQLIGEGLSVVVLEGAERIGGRAFTESTTFGVPFDHGCSWIAGPATLPYIAMARDAGFTLYNHNNAGEALFVGDRRANAGERRQVDAAYQAIGEALYDAGEKGLDVAAASVVPQGLPLAGIPMTWIGPMDWSVDFADLSTMDYWEAADFEAYFMIKEGYGTLVAELAAGLPVRLNTPARRVDWSGEGVAVETPAGTIRAKACIVTVSPGVLRAGGVRFTPDLPAWKAEAIDKLPMGCLSKIALQFDGETFGLAPDSWLSYAVPETMPAEACYFLNFPFGFDVMIGFVGGDFGRALSAAGPEAAIDFALGELVRMLGSRVRDRFVKGTLADWTQNPWTQGAYAAAAPGHFGARADLAKPLGDRVYFAGDSVAMPYVSLCGGAYLSGRAVAKEVSAAIA